MKRVVLTVLTAAVLATGCGHPLIPAAYTQTSVHAGQAAAGSTGLLSVTSKPLLGVDLYANGNPPTAQIQADGQRTLSYIKKTLKANAVSIVWNLYAPSRKSNTVTADSKTLSVGNLEILTEIAKQDGLKVVYRPLIFVLDQPADPWEGKITPTNPAKWFSNYYKIELPYLKAAQQFHVSSFVAETEMHAMNRNPGWTGFFKKIGRVYHGVVSYAAWDGDYFPPHSHLLTVPSLGMDFYEAMPQLRPSASEAKVLAGWEGFLHLMHPSVLERTTMQEIGIEARAGAYADPPNLEAKGKLDQVIQARWFTAACKSVHKYKMRGLFFWKVDLVDNPAHPTKAVSVFEGRQGAKAIAACAAILG